MTPPAVGLGTLSRLSAITGDPEPVLSVYLDFDPARSEHCAVQFEALVRTLGRRPGRADCERVRAVLRAPLRFAHGTRSIAVFATAEGTVHTVVPLPAPVAPMAVLEPIPWLEPVAGMLTSGDWGAAVVDRHAVRLLRGGAAGLVEFATAPSALRRGAGSRASSSTAPQAVQELIADQTQRLGRMLARAHARRPFGRLALAAPRALWGPLEDALSDGLRDRVIGALDLEQPLGDPDLRRALIKLLAHDQDGRRLRCERSTATAAGGGSRSVSHTASRLVRPLPEAAPFERRESHLAGA